MFVLFIVYTFLYKIQVWMLCLIYYNSNFIQSRVNIHKIRYHACMDGRFYEYL